jgi:EmrB/QacA subfamily drug resistance transporter
MAFIDGSVVNLALPTLQRELGATLADVQWIVEAYALILSALLLVGGAVGDRWGRRRTFVLGTALFALASALCGLSATVYELVAARALQGIGGALLVPGSLALIGASFGDRDRGRAIGIWSGFSAIAAGAGPVVGGWLVESLSWRWAFFLNLPLAVAVIAIAVLRVPESRDEEQAGRLDWPGALLVTVGLGGLVFGLIESVRLGFSHVAVVGSLGVGTAALPAFIAVELRSASPMVPTALFRSATFTGANLLTLLLYSGLGALLFFLPFLLIQVHGYSSTAAGAALSPFILIMFLLSRWSGGLVDRFGGRGPLVVGPLVAACGFALFAVPSTGGSYWATFFPPIVVLGLGMAVSVAPLTTVVMGAVPRRLVGAASGINNAVSRTAGVLAIAVFSVVVAGVFNRTLTREVDSIGLAAPVRAAIDAERPRLAGAAVPPGLDADVEARIRTALGTSFVRAFRLVVIVSALLALASALVAARTIRTPADGEAC